MNTTSSFLKKTRAGLVKSKVNIEISTRSFICLDCLRVLRHLQWQLDATCRVEILPLRVSARFAEHGAGPPPTGSRDFAAVAALAPYQVEPKRRSREPAHDIDGPHSPGATAGFGAAIAERLVADGHSRDRHGTTRRAARGLRDRRRRPKSR